MNALIQPNELPLRIGINVLIRPGDRELDWINGGYVTIAPKSWTELAGRIVPLYTECRERESLYGRCIGCGMTWEEQPVNGHRVLVGRGSIEVIPVMDCVGAFAEFADYKPQPCVLAHANPYGVPPKLLRDGRLISLALDPLPVPGKDWGVVIDVVELVTP